MPAPRSAADEPLGREVWIVAAVVVVGVIMSILDTTIVNVALETLSRELDAPLSTIQWVSTGYLLALATVIPLTRLDDRALRLEADLDDLGGAVRPRQRALRARLVGRVADRLPRAAGLRRRPDHADRDGAARPDRGRRAGRAGDERGRRADAARADPRPGDRRRDRRLVLVAVDLLRQRADRRRRARAGRAAAEGRRRPRRRGAPRLARAGAALARPRRDRVRAVGERVARRLRRPAGVGADRRRRGARRRCSSATPGARRGR